MDGNSLPGRWLRAFVRVIARTMVSYGFLYVPHPGVIATAWDLMAHGQRAEPEPGPELPCPPEVLLPGHPERLRPDLPLTALEERLSREVFPAPVEWPED